MSKIYKNQTDLTLKLITGKNLTGATSIKIAYKDPNGTISEWIATIENALTGTIKYDIVTPLNIAGNWTIWAKIIQNSLLSIGESVTFQVYNEGE